MLTGDSDAVGQKVASKLGLDHAYTELLPADKVERVETSFCQAKMIKPVWHLLETELMMPLFWQEPM